uniref:Membrane protein BRI3 n=1 Tax=Serinus canaria TaxID=9135 RepID=A0A8C9UDZ8_SERCA
MAPRFNQVAVRKWSLEPAPSFLRSIYTSKSLSLTAPRGTAACWPWHHAHSLHFRCPLTESVFPFCRVGVLEDTFTCLGVLCAIVFFPIGILFCLALRQRRCPNCGAAFG